MPQSAKKCIASWQKFLPNYEIIEWNEDNFDVNSIPYTAQAYSAKKYAFVSDYARYKILYEQGGLYFDTDVEVLKPFDDIIVSGPFLGFEINPSKYRHIGAVAPGLGMGAYPGMEIYKDILEYYKQLNFILPGGTYNVTDAVVNITTRELSKHGLSARSGIQTVAGINIYPADYFNPFDDATGRLHITSNTHSIHWFSKTWMNASPFRQNLSRIFHRTLGVNAIANLRKILRNNL